MLSPQSSTSLGLFSSRFDIDQNDEPLDFGEYGKYWALHVKNDINALPTPEEVIIGLRPCYKENILKKLHTIIWLGNPF